jgi:cytochrome c oxidase subunit 4
MAATSELSTHGGHDPDVDRTKQYVLVAFILAVLTAVEVATYPLMDHVDHRILTASLIILMVIKFATVTAYFMHLKFDKRILTVVFYSGLILALIVYLAVLTAFRFFGPPEDHMVPPTNQPAGQQVTTE